MAGETMQTLNCAFRKCIPEMQAAAAENPAVEVLVRAIRFSNGAQWHIADPTPARHLTWVDLVAGGDSDMGEALSLVAKELKTRLAGSGEVPPILALVSDGWPTDDLSTALRALADQPLGKNSVRVAVALGDDFDQETLEKFTDDAKRKPFHANSADALVMHFTSVFATALQVASSAGRRAKTVSEKHVPVNEKTYSVVSADKATQLAEQMCMFRPGEGEAVFVVYETPLPPIIQGKGLRVSGNIHCHCQNKYPFFSTFGGTTYRSSLCCPSCGQQATLTISDMTPKDTEGFFISLVWYDSLRPAKITVEHIQAES